MLTSFCLCTNREKKRFKEIIHYKNEAIFKDFEGTIIGQCINCGLLKTFPSKKNKLFNSQQSRGEKYETDSQKFIQLFIPIVKRIKRYKHKGAVLDVGCSTGLLLSLLKKEGFKIVGIEPNKTSYNQAYAKLGRQIFNGTLKDYVSQHKGKFDCVIYNHVLEHIEQVNKEIKIVKRILKKDGIFVIGVPNTRNSIFFLRQKYWESLMPNEHIWHFHSNYLVRFLSEFGFKVVNQSFYDDKREDYPVKKRIYFQILSLINKLLNTGEAVLLIMKQNDVSHKYQPHSTS